jgi:hypothetical protein
VSLLDFCTHCGDNTDHICTRCLEPVCSDCILDHEANCTQEGPEEDFDNGEDSTCD